jgi:hypothetical protein
MAVKTNRAARGAPASIAQALTISVKKIYHLYHKMIIYGQRT